MRPVLLCMALAAVTPSAAFSHPNTGDTHSLAAGIIHPFTGLDHTSVMALVGLWAALVGRRAIWAWPAIFILAMLIGFAAAACGLRIGFVESAIAMSIILFGFLTAFQVRLPVIFGGAIVGLFAFFHGHAHGTEAVGNLTSYAAGFTLSTASLLAVGIAIGLCVRRLVETIANERKRLESRETCMLSDGELP
jgi:urease accessory protein